MALNLVLLFLILAQAEALFLARLSSLFSPDPQMETSCEAAGGSCRMDLSCRMSYGQKLGECGGIYQVCCLFSATIEVSGARDMRAIGLATTQPDLWQVATNTASCGRPAVSNRRVVGGTEAGFGAFPWMALVRGTTSRCGGALISSSWVVTAGHCVKDHGSIFNGGYRVYLGEYQLYQNIEPLPRQKFSVEEVVLHPDYQFTPQADRFDVALLRLDRSAYLQPHVSPICLEAPTKEAVGVGVRSWVTGWGATDPESKSRPKTLQAVEVETLSNSDCEAWHRARGIGVTIYSEMMCAGHREGGRDSCQGDSGGPLMAKGDDGQWALIGLVSAGYSCAKPGQPGIYHRLSETAAWVQFVTSNTVR